MFELPTRQNLLPETSYECIDRTISSGKKKLLTEKKTIIVKSQDPSLRRQN